MTSKNSVPTIYQAQQMFYDYVLPRKLAANTIKAYEDDFSAINNHSALDFDEALVTALTSHELRAAFASYAIDHKAASIRRVHSTWKAFFKFLVIDGHVDGSPMDAVPQPKPPKREPLAFEGWEDDFVPKLIEGVMNAPRPTRYPIYVWRERDLAVVSMLLATGARASELCGMNINSIEGKPPDFYVRVRGKGDKPRSIPIEGALDEILGAYMETRKERLPLWKMQRTSPLFLPTRYGDGTRRMTPNNLRHIVETCLKASGLDDRRRQGAMIHAFRHTYGSVMAASGIRVESLRKLMGHDSISTTQGYIDTIARDERESAAKNPVYGALSKAIEKQSTTSNVD